MRHRWKFILSLVLTALFLTGCFSSPQQGEPGGEAPTVLVIWHSLTGNERAALEKELQRIMDQHLDLIVKTEYFPEADLVDTVYYAQAGGKGPDVIITRDHVMKQLYAKGCLAPFAGSVEDDFEAPSSAFKLGDTYYARAWLTDVPLLYYNPERVPVPPATVGALFEPAPGGARPVLALPKLSVSYLSPLWSAAGGKVYQGQPVLNSAANLAFAAQLQNWLQDGQLVARSDAAALFAAGEVPYLIDSAQKALEFSQKNVPWAAMSLTQLTGGKALLVGQTLAVGNSVIKTEPEHLAKIARLEELLLTPEAEGAMHKAGGRLPASAAFYQGDKAQDRYYQLINAALNNSWTLPYNAWERQLLPLLDEAWNNIAAGMEADVALFQAQNKALELVKSSK